MFESALYACFNVTWMFVKFNFRLSNYVSGISCNGNLRRNRLGSFWKVNVRSVCYSRSKIIFSIHTFVLVRIPFHNIKYMSYYEKLDSFRFNYGLILPDKNAHKQSSIMDVGIKVSKGHRPIHTMRKRRSKFNDHQLCIK